MIAHFGICVLAEDCRLVPVVLEFEQIVRGIFEKEGLMLDARVWKTTARLLIKPEALMPRAVRQSSPLLLGLENETEVTRVNALLAVNRLAGELRNDLVSAQLECRRRFGFPAQRTSQPVDVKPLRFGEVVDRKGEMKQNRHG